MAAHLRVAVADADGALVVHGTLVKGLDTVALGRLGRRKRDTDHLLRWSAASEQRATDQERVAGRQELAHADLEQGLALKVTLVAAELDLQLL